MKNIVVPDIDLKSELNKCKSMEDLVGKNGLMQRLFEDILQQFLEAEMCRLSSTFGFFPKLVENFVILCHNYFY